MKVDDLEVVGELGYYDWDWQIGRVLRDSEGCLYWGEAAGCSCDDWSDHFRTTDDLTRINSLAEAIELAKESFPDDDVARFAESLLF
jgi:hypothetical protein